MKKIIKYLLFIILLFNLNIIISKANEIIEGDFIDNVYIKRVPLNGKYYFSQARFIYNKTTNKILYCLDPFSSLINYSKYDLYTNEYAKLLNIDEYTWKKIEAYAYFGYLYPNHEDEIWYAVTQVLIWRTIRPDATIYFTDKLNGNKTSKFDNLITELDTIVNNYLKEPSFKTDIVLNLNETISFNLEGYNIKGNDILNVSNGNLTINGIRKIDTTYELVKGGNGVNELYLSNESQNVFASFGLSPIYTNLHVKVTSGNILINFKKEEGPYSNCSSTKKNIYGLYDSNDNLIDEIIVDNIDTYQSSDLPYGKYYVKQISNSCDVEKTNDVFEVEINEKNESPLLTIDILKVKSKLVIHKVYGYKGTYQDESNAKFVVADNNKSFSLITNEYGLAEIILGTGEYKIQQISGQKNYEFIGDQTILLNQSVSLLNLELKNERISANIEVLVKDNLGNVLSNVPINLYDKNNNLINTLSTDEAGYVCFESLLLDDYVLEPTILEGYKSLDKQNINLTNDIKILLEYEKIIKEEIPEISIPDTFSTVSTFWTTLASILLFLGMLLNYED